MKINQTIFTFFVFTLSCCVAFSQSYKIVGSETVDGGSVFSVNLDGTEATRIMDFRSTDGHYPSGQLLELENKMWGMTATGGDFGKGTIYSIRLDGSDYKTIHHFKGTDGSVPVAKLIVANESIWGITGSGGDLGFGTIFKLNKDGSNYTVVHNFDETNGKGPRGLTEVDEELWGVTSSGGTSNGGTIFKIDFTGAFSMIYDFDNSSNGRRPLGSQLTEKNGKLWGTTVLGGDGGAGIIFNIGIDGTGFTKVHDFAYLDENNGTWPYNGLAESDNKLWGMSLLGGKNDWGIIYNINFDGTGFTKILDFDNENGGAPRGSLVAKDNFLYGTTDSGGIKNDGVIFRIEKDGTNFTKIHDFDQALGASPRSLIHSGSELWVITSGGRLNIGAIVKIEEDGSNFSKVHDFGGSVAGNFPRGAILENGSKLWGMTGSGGVNGYGMIFKSDLNGENFSIIHSFNKNDGAYPQGSLVELGGKFWGMTRDGGTNGFGVIFSINIDGTEFTKIHDFDELNGKHPGGSLANVNDQLWGMTSSGGIHEEGVIFRIESDGSGFSKLLDFNGHNGSAPFRNGLTQSGDRVIGTTFSSETGNGVLFSISLNGSDYQNLNNLSAIDNRSDGFHPETTLVLSNNKLWGTMTGGGAFDGGVIFTIGLDGLGYEVVHSFEPSSQGLRPTGKLAVHGGRLWGSTEDGFVFNIKNDGSEFVSHQLPDGIGSATSEIIIVPNVADQTISFDAFPTSTTYGHPETPLLATSSSELNVSFTSSNENTAQVIGNSLKIVGAGTAVISAIQEGNEFFNPAPIVEQTVVVEKANLLTTASNQVKTFGAQNPTLTIAYKGFVNEDDETDLDTAPAITTTATKTSDTGEYPINLTGGADSNYEFELIDGVLTIEKADQSIEFQTISSLDTKTDPVDLIATASSGLSVQFTSSDASIASVQGSILTINSDGQVTVTASQEGDSNFNAASNQSQQLDIILVVGLADTHRIEIFPSPAKKHLNIELKNTLQVSSDIRIVSFSGQVIETFTKEGQSIRLDISELAEGIYFIEVENGNNIERTRFLKK